MKRRTFIAGLGSATAWPLVARAQQPAMPVIGVLDWREPMPNNPFFVAFRNGLAEIGYVHGRNVAIEYRWASSQFARLPALAAELVRLQVAVIVATGALSPVKAAKAATSTIPIVFAYGGDPVEDGLAASLNSPGGNITGMTNVTGELAGKRLSLVGDLVPKRTSVGFFSGDASYFGYAAQKSQILAAADKLGRHVIIAETRSERDYEAAFRMLVERQVGALIVGPFPFRNTDEIVALAALYKIPTIYPNRVFVAAGGLMSYANILGEIARQAGIYTGRILNGAKPADLPVVLPTKFQLSINLKTAKALGLMIPETLLATADEVIQ